MRLIEVLEKSRRSRECVEVAIAHGFSDSSEGSAAQIRKLAEARAQYVAELLERYGISSAVIAKEAKTFNGCERKPNACVLVEIVINAREATTCPERI
jgi:hypothetical protein